MAVASATPYPSFKRSFLKGSIFTVLLIGFFLGWAHFKGSTYKSEIISGLPTVVIPVTDGNEAASVSIEETPYPEEENTEIANIEEESAPPATDNKNLEDIKLYEENLVENSQFGLLPKPDINNNLTPFDAYKRNFIQPSGQRKFQLTLGPLIFSEETAQLWAETLPQDVSILLSPYTPEAEKVMAFFKDSGHEVWLELPIETFNHTIDTGTMSLRSDFSGNKNMSVYKQVLGQTQGYVGLLMRYADNTTLSFSGARMEQLQGDIYQRGVGLAYLSEQPVEALNKIASSFQGQIRHISDAQNNLFQQVVVNWDENLQSNQDISILYTPHPEDIAPLSEWLRTLPEKGYVLTPLSAPQSE